MNLFQITKKQTRNYGIAIWIGIISGIISGFVKSGTEGIMPPRAEGIIASPIVLLEHLGINMQGMVYTYSGYELNWGGSAVHIIFSIFVALIYCILAEVFPKIKLGQGLLFALVVVIASHGISLPLLGLSPAVWNLPFDEILSELIGTCLWMWTIEIIRRDLRNRITKKPDPEFQ